MRRVQIGGGVWFDADAALYYEESTRWNGQNRISCATGDQFLHEELIRTKSGSWLLHEWSQWQGGYDTYKRISAEEAAQWLVQHDHVEAAEKAKPGSVAAAEI
jgi:hypothetical protein